MNRMFGRLGIPTVARVATLAVLGCVALFAPLAEAQEHAGHDHHAMMAAAAGKEAPSRSVEMPTQPDLPGDLELVDASGRTVALRDVLSSDAPVLVNFIFTTCTTICPVMSAGFRQLQKQLATDRRPVRLVSISIDPDVDTPAKLREYAARQEAGSEWLFLTGSSQAVVAAQRAFGAYRGSKEAHAPATFIRRSPSAPWEQLDGLTGVSSLLAAYAGPSAHRMH
jgi:protein SCO1/2